jgi:cytochrome c553
MRNLRATIPLTLALLFAAGLASAGDPKTPLGKWMKPNMGAPMAGQDFGALQKGFDTVAGKPPAKGASSDYAQWASIAKGGSAAAAKQDAAGVKAACKQCHDQYKQAYIKDYLSTPFP